MSQASHVPELRIPRFSYEKLPVDWLAGNPLASCMGNALHMVFPAGERFFVRTVMHYKEQLKDDPELWPRVRGFAGQEGQHGYQHERVFDQLRAQGVPVDAFLGIYEGWSFGFLERVIRSPKVRLATTVAAEHLTATLARVAFESGALDEMSEEMGALLRWHALEELEHQHVAWDVLQTIDDSYALRLVGFAIISSVLFPFWFGGGFAFAAMREEGLWSVLKRSRGAQRVVPFAALRGALLEYLRRDYTPGKPGDDALIAEAKRWYEQVSQPPARHAA